MSENSTEIVAPETQEPAAAAPADQGTPPAKRSLEDLLGGLDDADRGVILGEVSKARNEAKNLRDRLKEAEPKVTEYDRLAEASKTETQRATDAAAAAQQRVNELTTRAINAEVKALAASQFADPADVAAFLDTSKYVNPAGDIDTTSIAADLADLLTRKPYLASTPNKSVPAPNPAQGSSANGPAAVAQMTETEMKRLYAEKRYDDIAKARDEGRLNALLKIT